MAAKRVRAAKSRSRSVRAARSRTAGQIGRTTKAGFVSAEVAEAEIPDYVVVQLRYEAPVAFGANRFAAPAAAEPQADSLNQVLSRFAIQTIRSQFGLPSPAIRSRVEVAATLPEAPEPQKFAKKGMDTDFIKSSFVQVVPKSGADAKKIADAFNKQKPVWNAYVAPRPVPTMPLGSSAGSRNFEPSQGYLYDAPNGIGAEEVWSMPGAKGNGVTICDIEGNWNRRHEDLPKGIPLIGGTVINDLGWRNHGTAVLGEMVSISDSRGCAGISHQAKAVVHSAVVNGVFNTAGAISNATSQLKAGDVILIELQATGPNGKYVAMQYWADTFAAIKAAVAKGVTVVEAAGNGNENFDLPVFKGTGLQDDSGAIIVGAGVPPTNHVDFDGFPGYPSYTSLGVPRSRIFFSNYGKIVSVQGWGWHVTTLGYGDAQGGASENTWYTLRFSGTSSASPIVAGAVACLQGRAKAKSGAPMTPKKVRNILIATGTRQKAGPGVPLSQHIGPLPDLVAAMKKV
jgi:subtilisin family serine protease